MDSLPNFLVFVIIVDNYSFNHIFDNGSLALPQRLADEEHIDGSRHFLPDGVLRVIQSLQQARVQLRQAVSANNVPEYPLIYLVAYKNF